MKILIVEDEPSLNALITRRLKKESYSVDSCMDGIEALEYIDYGEYDAIILDIMLPGKSGLEILSIIRKRNDGTPVLLLTAKDSIEDRVKGLDAGADDYLVKPFAYDELLARIRLITRRRINEKTNSFQTGDLVLDCQQHRVTRAGDEINLSAKEFAILEYFIRNKGIVLSREKIEQHIWNYDYDGSSNVIDVYIRYLRKKIDDPYEKKLIQTVRGSGYVLKE